MEARCCCRLHAGVWMNCRIEGTASRPPWLQRAGVRGGSPSTVFALTLSQDLPPHLKARSADTMLSFAVFQCSLQNANKTEGCSQSPHAPERSACFTESELRRIFFHSIPFSLVLPGVLFALVPMCLLSHNWQLTYSFLLNDEIFCSVCLNVNWLVSQWHKMTSGPNTIYDILLGNQWRIWRINNCLRRLLLIVQRPKCLKHLK